MCPYGTATLCEQPLCESEICAGSSITTVYEPDGRWRKIHYGNTYRYNEGKLLREEIGTGSVVVRTTNYAYDLTRIDTVYPARYGTSLKLNGDGFQGEYHRPQIQQIIQQDGVEYTTKNTTWDALSRPTTISRFNSKGYLRNESRGYFDQLSLWVLGQASHSTCIAPASCPGNAIFSVDYDPGLGLPVRTYRFGAIDQILSCNADGTVASVADGRTLAGEDTTVRLSNWKRGYPQLISYPDGTTKLAALNDSGWITAETDENGFITGYDYDAMGRVSRITYPGGDSTVWNDTNKTLEYIGHAELGIPAGHWRETVRTGTARKITYLDALWRPMVTQEFDAADQVNTQRLQMFGYNGSGQQTFSSYPVAAFPIPWSGLWTTYDVLGRQTAALQDSELGPLVSLKDYLAGGLLRETTPRGHATLTSFQALAEPSYTDPVSIQHPEGAVTEIQRDVFGKPLAITRRSTDGSISVTRSYVYSATQDLCKTVEPETGATLFYYDGAGNLAWSAAGLNYPSTASCNVEALVPSGRAVYRAYDLRNRPRHLRFPDGNGNVDWTYTPDGLPSLLTVWNDGGSAVAYNGYQYNKRRLLTSERSSQQGWYDWPITYTYGANGHLTSQISPSGLTVDYAPNALGQPTRAGPFATNVQYFPNGGVKQFTYGNGVVHTTQQNARQLPSRSTDAGVLDFLTQFDPNGNPGTIQDLALGSTYDRQLWYDGQDRLIAAVSPSFGGDYWSRYTYDALDNLKSFAFPGIRDHHYSYDSRNQVTNIRDGAGNATIGLSYDAQGNLRLRNGQSYIFDYGNRLREVVGKETYRYDALGRRIQANSPVSGNVLSQYAQNGQLIFQSDGRKGVGRDFVYLAGSLIAQREYNADGETITYLHTDALGSPVASSNASGQVVDRTLYEPYGAPIGKVVDGQGYAGHLMDGTTGLSYMQQRYMDPRLGVFLSVDPVTAYDQPVGQFNRYRYANGNPHRFRDPDGRIVETVWDVANVAMGATSAYSNFSQGNVGAGIVDSIGVTLDATAAAVPFLPGGAGTAIKAVRGGEKALEAVRGADRAADSVKSVGALPKPPTGRGSVAPSERDPKRFFDQGERAAKRAEQGGSCATGCGTPIDAGNSAGHHIQRHSDGGPTVSANHAEICKTCHDQLHSKDP